MRRVPGVRKNDGRFNEDKRAAPIQINVHWSSPLPRTSSLIARSEAPAGQGPVGTRARGTTGPRARPLGRPARMPNIRSLPTAAELPQPTLAESSAHIAHGTRARTQRPQRIASRLRTTHIYEPAQSIIPFSVSLALSLSPSLGVAAAAGEGAGTLATDEGDTGRVGGVISGGGRKSGDGRDVEPDVSIIAAALLSSLQHCSGASAGAAAATFPRSGHAGDGSGTPTPTRTTMKLSQIRPWTPAMTVTPPPPRRLPAPPPSLAFSRSSTAVDHHPDPVFVPASSTLSGWPKWRRRRRWRRWRSLTAAILRCRCT